MSIQGKGGILLTSPDGVQLELAKDTDVDPAHFLEPRVVPGTGQGSGSGWS